MPIPALPSLQQLENAEEFLARHIGIDASDEARMLPVIGSETRAELIDGIVPAAIRRAKPMRLPAPATEADALAELKAIAAKNKVFRSFIGQGYYGTHTPGVILRNVLENPAWYTAYTPYQAEISQGRMEALLNFQTMVCDLTGMAIANASMLDEATAAAEAMTLAKRSVKSKSNVFLVSGDCHPQTIEVIKTRAAPLGIEVKVSTVSETLPHLMVSGEFFGVLAQYPATTGHVHDLRPLAGHAHQCDAAFCVAADLLALTLLAPPGEWDADIVCGTTQRFGMPMCNGGPHAAYLACRDEFKRSLPGRLVGVSVDTHGQPAYRLALQTREQHIRREKATSNICTAQVLLAVMASMYAVYHGPDGLRAIARDVAANAALLRDWLVETGAEVVHDAFFDTLNVRVAGDAAALVEKAHQAGILLRLVDADTVGIAVDETTTVTNLHRVAVLFGGKEERVFGRFDGGSTGALPTALLREDEYLTHPVFHAHRSETAMMRYLKQLADRDYALDRGMIPLGSCTMKLNAATEMAAITWPEFAQLHPFAPADDVEGSLAMIDQLEAWLAEVTGYDAVS
ncbi:MAG TPA: aminomethyl-transferring glycine dehydrogenase subunit GcvPA, partial [Variovorax sp.]|nr:aminomethyl-transferring glycine dehydrogenase subunit GcvPA [Variovorax sp.]